MKRRLAMSAIICTILIHEGCGGKAGDQPILIFAAASLARPLDSLIADFERSTGTSVRVSYGSSGTLAQQIRAGATADLLLSADTAWIQRLAAEGENRIEEWWPILSNELVVFSAQETAAAPHSLGDLLNPEFQRIVIADPQSAPVGRYAQSALRAVGIYDSLAERIILADNATAVVTTVRAHLADAGIAYATDVAANPGLTIQLRIPDSLHPAIVYGLAVMRHANSRARDAAALLRSTRGLAVFQSGGFKPLQSPLGGEDRD